MKYLLDTDICIYLINNRSPRLEENFRKRDMADLGVSSITLFELKTGVLKSAKIEQNKQALTKFAQCLPILEFTQEAASCAAAVRTELEKCGVPIGAYDLLIAGIALAEDRTLVSNNVGEFSRIADLKLENWVG